MTSHQTPVFGSANVRVCFLSLSFCPKGSTGVSKVFKASTTHSLILGSKCAVLNSWKCNLWGFSLHVGHRFSVAGNKFRNEWTFYMYQCSGGEDGIHHLLVGKWLPLHCIFPVFVSPWHWATSFSTLAVSVGSSEIISFSCLGDESPWTEKIVGKSGSVLSQVHPYFCLQSIWL